jgi:alcohol dehydrogenase class IV
MVKPFQFSRLPKIYFKNGIIADLPAIIAAWGNKVIVVTGKSSFLDSLNADKFFNELKRRGITYYILSVPGEPSPDVIDQTVKKFSNEDVKLVIGIGGGSSLDAGKAVSAMMYRSESVVEYLEGIGNKEHPGTKLPYVAVPTTSGTGSEATKNAVISRVGKNGFKRSLRHDNFVPDIALVDPELTVNCPREITAAGGMDCFTQLTEAYLSDKSCKYTDALAIEGLRSVKNSLVKCYEYGEDMEARTGMSFAALTSGICLANAGLGVVHGFASSIGATYDIPHGLICGTLMAVSNKINIRELRKQGSNPGALKKYATLGELFLDRNGKTDEYYIDGFVDYLYRLTNDFHLTGFGRFDFKEEDIEPMCLATEIKNNPVKLSQQDLNEIILSAIK